MCVIYRAFNVLSGKENQDPDLVLLRWCRDEILRPMPDGPDLINEYVRLSDFALSCDLSRSQLESVASYARSGVACLKSEDYAGAKWTLSSLIYYLQCLEKSFEPVTA